MLTKYYRNRLSFVEALEQPMGFLHNLYYSAVKEAKSDAKKAEQQQEQAKKENNNKPEQRKIAVTTAMVEAMADAMEV